MEPQPPQPLERRGIRRGIYILPSLFTVGTLVCGYYAILSTVRAGQSLAAADFSITRHRLGRASYYAQAVVALDNAARPQFPAFIESRVYARPIVALAWLNGPSAPIP